MDVLFINHFVRKNCKPEMTIYIKVSCCKVPLLTLLVQKLFELASSKSGNGERGTGNGERGTGNGERGTGNGERGTGNGERGTGNGERGTSPHKSLQLNVAKKKNCPYILPNKNCNDLNLGGSLCMFTFLPFPRLWALSIEGFDFDFFLF